MAPRPVWQLEVWEPVPCGRCGRPVQFLPRQWVNRCGWCGLVVVRGVE